jgi:hypothetical protein
LDVECSEERSASDVERFIERSASGTVGSAEYNTAGDVECSEERSASGAEDSEEYNTAVWWRSWWRSM